MRRFIALHGTRQASWLSPENYEDLLASAQPYRADIMNIDENALAELIYTSRQGPDKGLPKPTRKEVFGCVRNGK